MEVKNKQRLLNAATMFVAAGLVAAVVAASTPAAASPIIVGLPEVVAASSSGSTVFADVKDAAKKIHLATLVKWQQTVATPPPIFHPAGATATAYAQRGEGVIRIVTRICGNAQGWQTVAARNNITPQTDYLVLLNQAVIVTCGLSSVASAPAPQVQQPSVQQSSGWVRPLAGSCVTSRFGWRDGKIHNGVDMPTGYGTVIRAAHAGTAYWGNDPGGAGLYVTVDHGNGLWTAYFHMSSRTSPNPGWVNAGDKIGEVGSTGNSSGPHLHFEVHPWGQWVKHYSDALGAKAYTDPVPFMADRGIRLSC